MTDTSRADDDDAKPRLKRRLFVLRLAALGGATSAAAACVPQSGPVTYLPQPAVVRGTGITDADPNDGPGYGRGGTRVIRTRTGYTDADPSDGPGYGRGGTRVIRSRSGLTDSDPSDGAGFGRRGW